MIEHAEYVKQLATREYLARRFREIYFIGSGIKYNTDSKKFESKYSEEMFMKLAIRTNNNFEFFIRGFNVAEEIIREEGLFDD